MISKKGGMLIWFAPPSMYILCVGYTGTDIDRHD